MACNNLKLAIVRAESHLLNNRRKLSSAIAATAPCLKLNRSSCLAPQKAQQRRTIVDRKTLARLLPYNYPDPWPYKERSFTFNNIFFNSTMTRLHRNSRIIVIEGNIGSGKSEFAAQLAQELGFYHMPAFSMNEVLIDRYGNDLRKFYHLFPKRYRTPDELMFYANPTDDNTAVMQDTIYQCRFDQHMNALAHIFNTGQGVVMERSVFSDFVFVNAMREKEWISPEYFKYYHFARKVTLPKLDLHPHLYIYLNAPISKCLENIKKRGNANEIEHVDARYLKTIEESYKDFLREVKLGSYVLSYDWAQPEYMDIVLEDIFNLNMDTYEWHTMSDVLQPWHSIGEADFNYGWHRWRYTHKTDKWIEAFHPLFDLQTEVAELYEYPGDKMHMRRVMMHEVLKDRCGYGWQKRDPITVSGMTIFDSSIGVPERWHQYWWKDYWYNGMFPPDYMFDPLGMDYDPDYLHAH